MLVLSKCAIRSVSFYNNSWSGLVKTRFGIIKREDKEANHFQNSTGISKNCF
ncbi:unnamed protein product [Brugia timori]|uniref:Uncharacterized protein n=1 Tax=Brugia timori TaxID=42155 RepID=A0A0R3QNT9_9BILA|nr:unnamed protein product [Brugia timori]